MKKILPYLFLMTLGTALHAQRYVSEIFSDVTVNQNVVYGVNATFLGLATPAQQAIPQPLVMDVYQPANDNVTERPLVIIFHTGNFVPTSLNGGCTGTIKDATVVETATRLAKMGYVAASADYRIGWLADNPDQTTRVYTLINAAYRGVQDSRTAVRFFKKSAAENGNPYGIDPNKITLMGFGTGGYITYASATLDTVTDTWIPKFITPAGPMVWEPFNGNVDGTTWGVTPSTGLPPFPPNDTLNYPNHVGYSSDFHLSISIGGALGDTSWIDENDPPMIGIQVPTDPFAPCGIGDVIVPPPLNLTVVEVMGSCTAIPIAYEEGLNDVFDVPLIDDVSTYVNSVNGGVEGFYPVFSNDPTEGSPWNWSQSLAPYDVPNANCDTAYWTGAKPYLDSIMTYLAPRMCLALDLGCDLSGFSNTNEKLDAAQVGLNIFPNPAADVVRFEVSSGAPIQHIYVYNMNGSLVKVDTDINASVFTMKRHNLPTGTYLAKVVFDGGFVTQKVMFK